MMGSLMDKVQTLDIGAETTNLVFDLPMFIPVMLDVDFVAD